MIGSVVKGRYKLIDERARGKFAIVYVARDLETNLFYAVKVMNPPHSANEENEMLARFQREARILQGLSDPHIVRLIDYGMEQNFYYIIMDYIDGHDLKEIMNKYGPQALHKAFDYTQQMAEGLDAADRKGVVHRDIKPQNILINHKGIVKITDFGLALSREAATITASDEFMGTAYYIAPEQVDHAHTADIRADLYSLAIILFEMLSGHPPFGYTASSKQEEKFWSIIQQHKSENVPSLCRLRPDLPCEIDRFLEKALAKDAGDRFQTPRKFLEALEQVVEVVIDPPPPPVIPPLQQKQAFLVILDSGERIFLTEEVMTVGRYVERGEAKDQPNIRLPDFTVGRRHARIRNRQGTFTVEDRHSKNHTYLNGEELPPGEERRLQNGDLLRFTNVETRFELH